MARGSIARSSTLRRHGAGLGVVTAVLLLAACGSSGGSSSPSSSSPTPSATSAAPSPSGAPATTAVAAGCPSTFGATISGLGPADTLGAATAVSTSYQQFFDPATPATTKIGLLQNGTAFVPVMQSLASTPLASKATVSVTAVDFTGAATANVTFNLCESGSIVMPASAGKSVLVKGVWQVADATLCGLVKLNSGGAAVPGCS